MAQESTKAARTHWTISGAFGKVLSKLAWQSHPILRKGSNVHKDEDSQSPVEERSKNATTRRHKQIVQFMCYAKIEHCRNRSCKRFWVHVSISPVTSRRERANLNKGFVAIILAQPGSSSVILFVHALVLFLVDVGYFCLYVPLFHDAYCCAHLCWLYFPLGRHPVLAPPIRLAPQDLLNVALALQREKEKKPSRWRFWHGVDLLKGFSMFTWITSFTQSRWHNRWGG